MAYKTKYPKRFTTDEELAECGFINDGSMEAAHEEHNTKPDDYDARLKCRICGDWVYTTSDQCCDRNECTQCRYRDRYEAYFVPRGASNQIAREIAGLPPKD
ncbi:hypothetical protein [Poriferisphaera sp. WC338]|uniref:hypothetical protein n=1 Tax=Poriferisphaera sp. WC338 TaxID=3425129 RepID=UPI003D81AFA6